MNQTYILLREVYRTAEIGKMVIGRMIKSCDDAALRAVLGEQFAAYHEALIEAEDIFNELGKTPKGCRRMEKMPIITGVAYNLKIDKTSSHMAEMLIRGNLNGFVSISCEIRENKNANANVEHLARRFKQCMAKCICQLTEFI